MRNLDGELNYEYAIKEVVRTRVLGNHCRISDTAKAIGVSVRSLQRRLAERGLSYKQLVEQARIEAAQILLNDTTLKLADIARELGYRHGTHFSRAFKRACGISPREFRIMHRD